MPTVRGRNEVKRFIAQLPEQIEKKLLSGAARAAAKVVATEAKERSISAEVSEAIVTRLRRETGRVVVTITVKPGWARSVGNWLEWGTSPHFISVDDSQRQGKSVSKINDAHKAGSLIIGGEFVGSTVFHPGARPHPFLRPALDTKEAEAIAAAQGYIRSRITRSGILGGRDEGGDE